MTSEDARERARLIEFAERIALRQLESRARSEHELRTVLARREVPADIMDVVIEKLKDYRYVDDEVFARSLVSSRVKHSARGRMRIRQELQGKGIERDAVDAALEELDPADEWDAARAFAHKKARSMSGLEHHVAMRRLTGALARRGFGMDMVLTVAREALGDAAEAD